MSQRPTIRTPIRGTDPLFIDLWSQNSISETYGKQRRLLYYGLSCSIFILLMYMSQCSGRDWARRNAQPWNPGYVRRQSTSTSSSTVTNPTPPPVSSASMSSTATYSFEPSTEQSQVALPVLIIAGCIVGIFLCGMALAINHLWRTRRTNEQPVEEEQRVSSHKTLDWSFVIV